MDVAVVGAVVGALVNNIVAKLVTVVAKRSSELGALRGDITCLKTELELIATTTDAMQRGQAISDVQQIAMDAMRDLAFEVEDCLDQFLPCAACGGGAVAIVNLVEFALQVTDLKRRLKEAHEQINDANASQQAPSFDGQSVGIQAAVQPSELSEPSAVVGIEEPKKEILGLLDREKLMVISIVGFGGSGKTQLARAVYECNYTETNFGLHTWHAASEHKDGNELLVAIVKDLHPDKITLSAAQMQSQISGLHNSIQKRLRNKRCLIVIDDVEEKHHWGAIHNFVSKIPEIKILLTTSVQTVAKACTRDGGYIYNMRTLSARHSEDLLKKKVGDFNTSSADLANGSDAIVRKCHGHPLALISVANYLLRRDITGEVCQSTSRLLCTHVNEDRHGDFTKLRNVLENNYISLPVHLKTCLLYISLFPNDPPVSRKTLTSRLLAEGYIKPEGQRTQQEAADDKLEQLMDRNIITPIDTSYRGGEKTFKPHGIMHQFMLYKSNSSNFIASSLQDRGNYRHIIMEDRTNRRASDMDHGPAAPARRPNFLKKLIGTCFSPSTSTGSNEQLRPRSLTVFGSAEEAFYSDLINCKLLRVLDLKECNNLVQEHIKKIYKLLHLKYLTLGSSVRGLSDKMENLHCLETLDLRKTKIETLPVEVISLPHLVHLFGMIKLSKLSSKKISKFLSRECNLETLSGVVIERKSRFPELMAHMKQLKKLKIWCRTTSRDRNYTKLLDAISKFAKADMSTPQGDRFLSFHLHESSKDLLPRLQGADTNVLFYLSSLKLHGRPTGFHEFATILSGLKELCLTNSNLKGDDLLAGLRELKCLVYLKLVEVKLEDLVIDVVGDLASLKRLCLVVQQPKFPQITEGALPGLVSLQLLCKDLEGLCDGINVEYFKYLREVALDSRVHRAGTIEVWEKEAEKHPRMPKVVLLKRVEPAYPVKYVAADHESLESLAQETS